MEPLRKQQVTRVDRRAALAGLALAALSPLGCMKHLGTGTTATPEPAAAPAPPKGRLVSTWDKRVVYAPDAYHGGAIIPGLVGQVFLFGPDMAYPYIGDGELKLDLWDCTTHGDKPPRQMEHYIIAPDVLKQFAKADAKFGENYTIFFPWPTYRQEVKQVYITMLYTSAKGERFFHQSGVFAVDHTETTERISKGMTVTNPALQVSTRP